MKSLFDEHIPDIPPKKAKGIYQTWKQEHRYRISISNERRCKFCEFFMICNSRSKTYFKCKIMGCSFSEATDIRAKNVCDLFQTGQSKGGDDEDV